MWIGTGLALLLVAISCGVCGLLFSALTTETPESAVFWITRGCFVGPAFALGFLAYGAFVVGRRREHSARCGELITAFGVAVGLIPVLMGLAFMLQPAPESDDVLFGAILCFLPGLFVVLAFGLFWVVVVRRG